jgi:hypothetical protein
LLLVSILVSPGAAKQTGSISPFIDREPMIHHAEMRAQVGLIFEKNGCCGPNRLTAALQEDTPLKKHRLVLFSVSESKDALF